MTAGYRTPGGPAPDQPTGGHPIKAVLGGILLLWLILWIVIPNPKNQPIDPKSRSAAGNAARRSECARSSAIGRITHPASARPSPAAPARWMSRRAREGSAHSLGSGRPQARSAARRSVPAASSGLPAIA